MLKGTHNNIAIFRIIAHKVCGIKYSNDRKQIEYDNQLKSVKVAPVKEYVINKAMLCQPDSIHVCDGSKNEESKILELLVKQGAIKQLTKYENCWLARTDPADVARVESRTFISTKQRRDTIPSTSEGVKGTLGNWMSPEILNNELDTRFPGCMRGRTMYVIPFSMGPVGGPLSKLGLELTDSPYVVASMRIMTRMGLPVMQQMERELLKTDDKSTFVRALHSVGVPLPTERSIINGWPCNPEKTIIAHSPATNEIFSYGSGYGGNSLLGKKCFALRLGSILARDEGWLAEHMLILGITNRAGVKRYIAAAFPSACGKTNLAMMQPALPGFKVECVGDDIAWMKFDKLTGELRAINPESGFFGVAPGTSYKTNPNAMKCINRNTIFTNVAETSDGGYFWEGLEKEIDLNSISITDWHGNSWSKDSGEKAAHPNSRFCTPAGQCPVMDPAWESSEGVPISAIIFGGRRPAGVPLVMESLNWQHGVLMGASLRSEATAAAEHSGKKITMHDPFAMRPFFGYNFGDYLRHWLNLKDHPASASSVPKKLPRIFHVNWFRRQNGDPTGNFLWPGFGENARVLDWILKRVEGDIEAQESPIGLLPYLKDLDIRRYEGDTLTTDNICTEDNIKELLSVPTEFWMKEMDELKRYFSEQVGDDMPSSLWEEFDNRYQAFKKINN